MTDRIEEAREALRRAWPPEAQSSAVFPAIESLIIAIVEAKGGKGQPVSDGYKLELCTVCGDPAEGHHDGVLFCRRHYDESGKAPEPTAPPPVESNHPEIPDSSVEPPASVPAKEEREVSDEETIDAFAAARSEYFMANYRELLKGSGSRGSLGDEERRFVWRAFYEAGRDFERRRGKT